MKRLYNNMAWLNNSHLEKRQTRYSPVTSDRGIKDSAILAESSKNGSLVSVGISFPVSILPYGIRRSIATRNVTRAICFITDNQVYMHFGSSATTGKKWLKTFNGSVEKSSNTSTTKKLSKTTRKSVKN